MKLWQVIGYLVVGGLLSLLSLFLILFFLTARPSSQDNLVLSVSAGSGKSDIRVEISQDYINREVASSLAKKPITFAVVKVTSVQVEVLSSSIISANV